LLLAFTEHGTIMAATIVNSPVTSEPPRDLRVLGHST